MDLGRINVRGQNVNLLWQAIHPQHGLVWSNGKAILLEKVSILDGQVENSSPLKLGEFEHPVQSVHWSSNVGPNTCYLCVVHSQHVSIWKVDGLVPKLNFKQVRKLNVQPIPQGCLWNPDRDILCVLGKQQCSFFFSHTQKKGSFAFPPLESSGKIKCGTWTTDGKRLVIAVGASLLVYFWTNIDESISSYDALVWKIPNLEGSVNSIVTLSDDMVLCAAELPLESLCKVKDTFVVPDIYENTNSSQTDIITPKKSGSVTETLLNLSRNPQCDIESTTQLITVRLADGPSKISTTAVKGVLSPELLLFMPHLKTVVVGSNTQNLLQVFSFQNGDLNSDLIKSAEITLAKQERPKGISNVLPPLPSQPGVLITVGKRASSDSAFLSSSKGSAMEIKLKYFPFTINQEIPLGAKEQNGVFSCENIEKQNGNLSGSGDSSLREVQSKEMEDTPHILSSESTQTQATYNQDLHISKQETVSELRDFSETDSESSPRDIIIGSQLKGDKPVIEDLTGSGNSGSDLETETADFSQTTPCFQNNLEQNFQDTIENHLIQSGIDQTEDTVKNKAPVVERSNMVLSLDDSAVSMATSGISVTTSITESTNMERMQLDIDKLNHRIEELKLKVGHLTNLIQESTIITRYQSQQEPELIQIECQCPETDTRKKTFLLDHGRLQYEAVRRAFGLSTLEILINDEPCVVSANIDGYIPMRFTPSSTLIITGTTDKGDNTHVV